MTNFCYQPAKGLHFGGNFEGNGENTTGEANTAIWKPTQYFL